MPGILAQFFHALEVSANGTLEADLERIRLNNEADGAHFGRRIDVKVLYAEVPMHYLALVNGDRLHRGVEQGVRAAREWCRAQGIEYEPIDRSRFYDDQVRLRFTDHLSGRLGDCAAEADLTLIVTDAGEFMNAGRQRVVVCGTVTCALFRGMATVERGYADILVDVTGERGVAVKDRVIEEDDGVDPTLKRFVYVLHLRIPHTGRAVTLVGVKNITERSVKGAVRDAMTMECRVMDGHVGPDAGGEPLATGQLRMTFWDVAKQFARARAKGPSLKAEAAGLARYGMLFAGNLWDVAARKWLTYAPF
jgi:hypothetical protein